MLSGTSWTLSARRVAVTVTASTRSSLSASSVASWATAVKAKLVASTAALADRRRYLRDMLFPCLRVLKSAPRGSISLFPEFGATGETRLLSFSAGLQQKEHRLPPQC